jgi:hypothetical protein
MSPPPLLLCSVKYKKKAEEKTRKEMHESPHPTDSVGGVNAGAHASTPVLFPYFSFFFSFFCFAVQSSLLEDSDPCTNKLGRGAPLLMFFCYCCSLPFLNHCQLSFEGPQRTRQIWTSWPHAKKSSCTKKGSEAKSSRFKKREKKRPL